MAKKLIPCKACKKEVAEYAKTCPHCGVSNPGITVLQGLLGVIVLVALTAIGVSFCSTDQDELVKPKSTSTIESTSINDSSQKPEPGLTAGFINIKALDEDLMHALKLEVLSAGKDPNSLYPSNSMALITVPVGRLNMGDMQALWPLLCEITTDQDPNHWLGDYDEVLVLNKHSYIGFSIKDWNNNCTEKRIYRTVAGRWDAVIPWEVSVPVDTIGYGDYQ